MPEFVLQKGELGKGGEMEDRAGCGEGFLGRRGE